VRARCSQRAVSDIERGHAGGYRLDFVRSMFRAVDASFDGSVAWRAGDLDRLLDERHSRIVDNAAARLRRLGWEVTPEFTYAEFGERGSIDLLGVRRDRTAVAVLEIKSDLVSIEATLRKHDEKARLMRDSVGFRLLGWRPRAVGRFLVIGENRSARRLVASHTATFDAAYPLRSRHVAAWLRNPSQSASGLWFLTLSDGGAGSQVRGGSRRVRVVQSSSSDRGLGDPNELRRSRS
jgi:hypothetical protein